MCVSECVWILKNFEIDDFDIFTHGEIQIKNKMKNNDNCNFFHILSGWIYSRAYENYYWRTVQRKKERTDASTTRHQ